MKLGNSGPWLGQVPLVRRPSLGANSPVTVSDATFDQQVTSAPKAVVDFWSPSCPICMAYKPVFEAAAAQVPGDVLMVEANVYEANQKAQSFGLRSIPTTIFLAYGKEVNRIEGQMSQQDLLNTIATSFGGSAPAAAAPAPSTSAAPARTAAAAPSSSSAVPIVAGGLTLAAIGGLGYLLFA